MDSEPVLFFASRVFFFTFAPHVSDLFVLSLLRVLLQKGRGIFFSSSPEPATLRTKPSLGSSLEQKSDSLGSEIMCRVNPDIHDFGGCTSLLLSLSRPLSQAPLPFGEDRWGKDKNFL